MNESWMKNIPADWSVASALKTLEELGGQVKRAVDVRMKKGDVRSAVIRLLAEKPMHGYQIMNEIETRSGGAWKPSPGSVYPTLQLLADEALIESSDEGGRRTYSLTATGKEVADAEASSTPPWETGIDHPSGPRGNLAMAGARLAKAAADVARSGNTDDIDKATKLLDDATRALGAIVTHN
ncbi:MAG: hypothetical protein RIS25_1356 [Actinomycetota bacterium]|jgi:DNA-binding PadR family transcriptional regulator